MIVGVSLASMIVASNYNSTPLHAVAWSKSLLLVDVGNGIFHVLLVCPSKSPRPKLSAPHIVHTT